MKNRSHKNPIRIIFIWLLSLTAGTVLFHLTMQAELAAQLNIFKRKPALSTHISDAVTDISFLDDFNPENFRSMTMLPRGSKGEFLLRPGLFEFHAQSYCLHAGTYAPGEGDGYINAPLKGPMAGIVHKILQMSYAYPQISQQDIQVLLWAVISRTKLSDMSLKMKLMAAKLLSPKEIFKLNGGALGLIPERLKDRLIDRLPAGVRRIVEAEWAVRRMLTRMQSTYRELEEAAVLFGDAPEGEDSRLVPEGRWSYHPEGYFIRFFPQGYTGNRIQVCVPEVFSIERDALGRILSVSDPAGNRIETEYDDRVEPLTVKDEPDVRGYAFRSIRFTRRVTVPPELDVNVDYKWKNRGWLLKGIPSAKGTAQPSGRFDGFEERRQLAKKYLGEIERLSGEMNASGHLSGLNDLIDVVHYKLALQCLVESKKVNDISWGAAHLDLIDRAWQYFFLKLQDDLRMADLGEADLSPRNHASPPGPNPGESGLPKSPPPANGGDGARSPSFDPSANVSTPGNTARQRIGNSSRDADKDADREDVCKQIKELIQEKELIIRLYENPYMLDFADKSNMNGELYQQAIENLFEMEVNGDVDLDNLTIDKVSEAYSSRTEREEKGYSTAKTMMMATYQCCQGKGKIVPGSVRIVGYDKNGNESEIWKNGKTNDANIEKVKEAFKDEYGDTAGEIAFESSLVREMKHVEQYMRDGVDVETPDQVSEYEIEGYKAELETLKKALKELGCD